jgi:hypothetical protein
MFPSFDASATRRTLAAGVSPGQRQRLHRATMAPDRAAVKVLAVSKNSDVSKISRGQLIAIQYGFVCFHVGFKAQRSPSSSTCAGEQIGSRPAGESGLVPGTDVGLSDRVKLEGAGWTLTVANSSKQRKNVRPAIPPRALVVMMCYGDRAVCERAHSKSTNPAARSLVWPSTRPSLL